MTVAVEARPLPAGSGEAAMRRLFPQEHSYRNDPEAWIDEKLRERLWSKQREIAASVVANRRTAVQSCHGAGKSYLASRIAAWWLDTHPIGEAFVVTTAPSAQQVNAVLWREIKRAHRRGRLFGEITGGMGGSVPEWKIGGELVAFGRKPPDSADDMEAMSAFQGIHAGYVLFVLDEAGGVPPWLFQAGETIVTGENDRVLAIGNPDDPASHFAEVCQPGSLWNVVKIAATDTPRFTGEPVDDRIPLISPTWVEERAKLPGWQIGGALYTARVLGEFPDVSVDALFSPRLVRRAQQTTLPGLERGGYGVDVARYGEDETVVYRNRAGVLRLVRAVGKQDTEETADMVAEILDRHGAAGIPAVVDGVGVGAGVVDKLRHRGKPVIDFNGAERAHDPERFANRRAEIFWQLRQRMEDGLVDLDPADRDLAKQLLALRWKTSAGRVIVESKEDMRKRGVKSPDRADAAAYATCAPATPASYVAPPARPKSHAEVLRDGAEGLPAGSSSLTADLLEARL